MCPICGKTLTASSSQGKCKKYYYYHCTRECKYRIRTDFVNANFLTFLKEVQIDIPFLKIANDFLKEIDKGRQEAYQSKKREIGRAMDKSIDRSLNAHQLFSMGKIDYDDYFLIKNSCKVYLKNYASELREQALKAGVGMFGKKEGNNIFCHLGDIYEVSDISIKQKIARLFFPEKVIVNENILNMLPEFIKIIFGIKLEKSGARVGETLGNDEKINHFLKEISLFAFEQQLKTI